MTLCILESARIPEETSYEKWANILEQLDGYSFFQTPRWSQILVSVISGAKARHRWFKFSDGTEAVLPLISVPKFLGLSKLESLVWGTYGGLLSSASLTASHLTGAVSRCLSWREPICVMTLKPGDKVPELGLIPATLRERTTHILQLNSNFEIVWANHFKPRIRTAIRKAEKTEVTFRWSNSGESVETLKQLYRQACLRWKGIETLPLSLFDSLVDLPGDEVRIWLVERDGKALAADLVFYGKGEVQYYAGARDENYSQLNGSKLLMSEIIRDACERGFSTFNLGGGDLSGVVQFKESFGGKPIPYSQLRFHHAFLAFFPGFVGRQ